MVLIPLLRDDLSYSLIDFPGFLDYKHVDCSNAHLNFIDLNLEKHTIFLEKVQSILCFLYAVLVALKIPIPFFLCQKQKSHPSSSGSDPTTTGTREKSDLSDRNNDKSISVLLGCS